MQSADESVSVSVGVNSIESSIESERATVGNREAYPGFCSPVTSKPLVSLSTACFRDLASAAGSHSLELETVQHHQ